MTIRFKGNIDPHAILQRLGVNRSIDPQTSKAVFREIFEHRDLAETLFDELDANSEVPEAELRSAFHLALFGEPFTVSAIVEKLNRFEVEYLERPAASFVLVSTISALGQMPTPSPDPDGCQLEFALQLSAPFGEERQVHLKTAEHMLHAKPRDRVTYASVATTGRSDHQAAEKGLNALDLQRGLWNFLLNSMTHTNITVMGIHRPINSICLGPVHTLHFPDGRLASEVFWYEPEYVGAAKEADLSSHSEELSRNAAILTKLIGDKSPKYAADLRNAFRRYARILDDASWESAFVGLWSLLEFLTGTTRADYERMVKRVAFLFDDHEYVRQVLGQLRDHRNRAVHSGKYPTTIELHLHRLKHYVHQLFLFHLRFQPSFDTMVEAAGFLDQPVDVDTIERRMGIASLALRFRQSGRSESTAA